MVTMLRLDFRRIVRLSDPFLLTKTYESKPYFICDSKVGVRTPLAWKPKKCLLYLTVWDPILGPKRQCNRELCIRICSYKQEVD